MKLDFGILYSPESYHKAADKMARLPQMATVDTKEIANVNDDIPAYCSVGQINELDTVPIESEDEGEPVFTINELMEAHANDVPF